MTLVACLWIGIASLLGEPQAQSTKPETPFVAPAPERPPVRVLHLEAVLASVQQHHPLLAAADASTASAVGRRLSARGAFDPRLRVRGAGTPLGGYRYGVVETEVRVRTLALGMVAFAGWRLGRGNIPVYDGRAATASAGELRAGIEVPVLRDAMVDAPRTLRRKADVDVDIASLERQLRVLELSRDAAIAYLDWSAATTRAEIRARQLELAVARDAGVRRQIAGGNNAAVEALDNARVIATREALAVTARRDVEVAALALSLFFRTKDGAPRVPHDLTPGSLASPLQGVEPSPDADLHAAMARRPELRMLAARLRSADLDVRLAGNARLPSLTVQTYAAKDLGDGPAVLLPAELGIGAMLEVAVPLRTARGDLASARAVARRLKQERLFLAERVGVEIRSAGVDVRTARVRVHIAARQAELAEQLAAAERQRLAFGDTNILVVNLREEAAADAAASVTDALADYHKARARYDVATGAMPRP